MNYKKVAIIGGSFDPVHKGHVAMGKAILQHLDVEQVLYIPTKQNPLKKTTQTMYQHRVNMLQLVMENNMQVYENDAIYTIDLVQSLPFETIYFVIGDDQIQTLHQWKEFEKLKKLVQFVVFERNNTVTPSEISLLRLPFKNHFESSTAIRKGEFHFLDEKVRNYIFKHELYIHEILRNVMNEKRYLHTLSVANTAKKLALAHGFMQEEENIKIAALLHDYAKCFEDDILQQYMQQYFPNESVPSYAWHGYVASVLANTQFGITNQNIISAIKNHTIVKQITPFNLIIKLADVIEPTRKVIPESVKNMAYINLEKAYANLLSYYKENNDD